MKTFDGAEGDEDEDEEGERWDTPGAAAGATEYAQ